MGTLAQQPSRVDTRDHLSASAGTIWVYDSESPRAFLAADSVSGDRRSRTDPVVGRARGGGRLRRFGQFSSRGAGAGRGWTSQDYRSRLCRVEQSPAAVAVRRMRRLGGASEGGGGGPQDRADQSRGRGG